MRRVLIAGGGIAGIIAATVLLGPASPAHAAVACNFRPATIIGTPGNDIISGTAGDDVIFADAGNDNVSGLGGNDLVCLGTGNDSFTGGPGDDTMVAEAGVDGTDQYAGGPGSDGARYFNRTVNLVVSLDNVPNDGAAGENDNIHDDVENVTGSQGVNRLTGSAADNVLDGGNQADTILGAGGNDLLRGGGGNDTLSGGAGNDFVLGNTGDDTYIAAAGADGVDFFEGSVGSDTASYVARTSSVFVSLDNVANDGALGEGDDMRNDVENIIGGTAGDVLTVRSFATNRLNGGQGNDILNTVDFPFISNDVMDGSFGVDTCTGDPDDTELSCEL